MERNDFFEYLETLTNVFVKNIIKLLNNELQDETEIKKISFEIRIFFLVNFAQTFRDNFPDNSYNDIITFFHNKIIFNLEISNLYTDIEYKTFLNDRFNFHHEGKLELSNYHKIKNRFPLPNDYSQLLITLFNNPLKEIDKIISINSNSFLNPFESVNKEVLTSNIYRIKLVCQENLIKAISRTKKW